MFSTTLSSFTPVVVAPRVPQSISMCFSSPPTSNVMRKQSPRPCRYMRTRTFGLAAALPEAFFFFFVLAAFFAFLAMSALHAPMQGGERLRLVLAGFPEAEVGRARRVQV